MLWRGGLGRPDGLPAGPAAAVGGGGALLLLLLLGTWYGEEPPLPLLLVALLAVGGASAEDDGKVEATVKRPSSPYLAGGRWVVTDPCTKPPSRSFTSYLSVQVVQPSAKRAN